jgi:hypothetical protein
MERQYTTTGKFAVHSEPTTDRKTRIQRLLQQEGKDAEVDEVGADDVQNALMYLAPVNIGTSPQILKLNSNTGSSGNRRLLVIKVPKFMRKV